MQKLSRNEFYNLMTFIKNQHKKEETLRKAMCDMSKDFYVDFYPYNEYETQMVKLLNKMFDQGNCENGESDIEYYLYELDYGKKYKDFPIECPNGETIYLSSPKVLYDLMEGKFD